MVALDSFLFSFLFLRPCTSSHWWYTSSCTAYHVDVSGPYTFYNPHGSLLHGRVMDSLHSWLHPWEVVACDGCWLPHHPPHHLPPQLWPLYHLHGLVVRYSSNPCCQWWGQVKDQLINDDNKPKISKMNDDEPKITW